MVSSNENENLSWGEIREGLQSIEYLPGLLAIVPTAVVVVRRLLPHWESLRSRRLACISGFLSSLVSTRISLQVTDLNLLHGPRDFDEGSRLVTILTPC